MSSVFVLITLLVNSVEPEVLAEHCGLCSSFFRQSEFLGVIFILIISFRFSLSGIKA